METMDGGGRTSWNTLVVPSDSSGGDIVTGVRVAVALVIALLSSEGTWAGINQWTPIGPTGGMVTGLALDSIVSDLAFATTFGGFFRSTDGGSSWTASNDGLRDAHLQSLVVAGGALYVAGDDGISRSDDQGLHGVRFVPGRRGSGRLRGALHRGCFLLCWVRLRREPSTLAGAA